MFNSLNNLSEYMDLEPAEEQNCPSPATRKRATRDLEVSHAALPNGKQITLLKTLLTSACERDCNYCPFRAGRDFRRATLQPDEMAQAFMALSRAGIAEGLFLSSGIVKGGVHTQDQLIDTAEILRNKYGFKGYLHLKIMPGSEFDQVKRAMQLADRVSVNLEAPNEERLTELAPHKKFFDELFRSLKWIHQIRTHFEPSATIKGHWPSMTTQFVVGAVGESDLELLATTARLQQEMSLSRAYFSAFHPIQNTPLESTPATHPLRQHRLYQASFLLRDYGYDLEDLPFETTGNLPIQIDPKLAWAKENLCERPVEINRADRNLLLRLPGVGPKSVKAILAARRKGTIQNISDLKKLGINIQNVLPFILLDGKPPARQLFLWAADQV